MTFYPTFDGTFSTEACAAAGHALLDQLHAQALATIADIAENWDRPAQPGVVRTTRPSAGPVGQPTTWSDPETWSIEDDEELLADELEEAGELLVRPLALPALPPLPVAVQRRPSTRRELVLHR